MRRSKLDLRLGHGRDGHGDYGQGGPVQSASMLTSLASAGNVTGAEVDTHASQYEQPYVLAEGVHWFALYKPPSWQVNVDSNWASAGTISPHGDEGDANVASKRTN